jgi:predicted peptidase
MGGSNYAPSTSWPVIVFMHGNGSQGEDGTRQTTDMLADAIRQRGDQFPGIVVFPQAQPKTTWALMEDLVITTIDAAVKEFHGDTERVYLLAVR